MKLDLVEELFAELMTKSPAQRKEFISAANYPEAVKEAATKLLKAHETKSELLNEDLLTDIARIDPKFFDNNLDPEQLEQDQILQPGNQIGDYRVESLLGIGGMSVVYKARQDHPIKRRVAIKLIRPSLLAPKMVLRFVREQQALALVAHPNIATLYEVGSTEEGQPFAVMEYVKGLPITEFCEKTAMDSRQRIILFTKTLEGLKHAHQHGVIHRDIKPDNILIAVSDRKPTPKLIDFGIAKLNLTHGKNPTMTQVGQILGSPRYMSPEQFDNQTVDQRSDVYSAALVLFELLARSPYRSGDTTEEIIVQAKSLEPELISQQIKRTGDELAAKLGDERANDLIKFCKRDLDWILNKALAANPDDRYPDIESFSRDLRAAVRNEPVSVSRPNSLVRSKRIVKSNRRWIALAGLLALIGLAWFGFSNWWASENRLSNVRKENSAAKKSAFTVQQNAFAANQKTAAANELIVRLLSSDNYELTTDRFDLDLIPAYRKLYDQIQLSGGPQSKEDKTVCGILAVLYAMKGEFVQADELMEQVADEQDAELRQLREKICSEYAETAKERLASLEGDQNSFERATQQVTLGRCYIVWGMLDEAEALLKEAIAFFDSHKPGCYEALAARITLAKIHEQANADELRFKLLSETRKQFRENSEIRSTTRGREAFTNILKQFLN